MTKAERAKRYVAKVRERFNRRSTANTGLESVPVLYRKSLERRSYTPDTLSCSPPALPPGTVLADVVIRLE